MTLTIFRFQRPFLDSKGHHHCKYGIYVLDIQRPKKRHFKEKKNNGFGPLGKDNTVDHYQNCQNITWYLMENNIFLKNYF